MKYKCISLYFFCFVIFSCNTKEKPYANSLGIEPAVVAEIDTANYTLIRWQDSIINFGTLKINDSVHLKYKFTNIGKTPLFIIQARPSCGCTVTNFTKDPVMPGKSGFITATMQSGFHTGPINKSIAVVSNTKNKKTNMLIIRGTILPADKK